MHRQLPWLPALHFTDVWPEPQTILSGLAAPTSPDLGFPDVMVTMDGGPPDAALLPLNTIFATFNGVLVRIDPDTANLTVVGTLSDPAVPTQKFLDVSMHWSGSGNSAVAILGFMTPQLATVDLCMAKIVPGPPQPRVSC